MTIKLHVHKRVRNQQCLLTNLMADARWNYVNNGKEKTKVAGLRLSPPISQPAAQQGSGEILVGARHQDKGC
jgi:hypothetical protein